MGQINTAFGERDQVGSQKRGGHFLWHESGRGSQVFKVRDGGGPVLLYKYPNGALKEGEQERKKFPKKKKKKKKTQARRNGREGLGGEDRLSI